MLLVFGSTGTDGSFVITVYERAAGVFLAKAWGAGIVRPWRLLAKINFVDNMLHHRKRLRLTRSKNTFLVVNVPRAAGKV